MSAARVVLDEDDIRRTLVRIAHEIVEKNAGRPSPWSASTAAARTSPPACTRWSCDLLDEEVPLGDIDIAFYRDDVATRPADPAVHARTCRSALEDCTVVLVDDVLYTGRTVRAGIDALFDYGRPARVQLAVLADRGHRELPIRPDYVGKNLPTARSRARQRPRRRGVDGVDEVDDRRARGGARLMRHLLSIEDLDRAGDRAHPRPRAIVHRGLRARDQEGARAARPPRAEPLLRGLHAHPLARSSWPPSRSSADVINFVSERLERREGRVAQGHGPDAAAPTGPT